MQNSDELLVDVPEASTILGVSPATVCRWAQSGKLPYLHKGRGRTGAYLFDVGAVRRVAQQRVLRKAG